MQNVGSRLAQDDDDIETSKMNAIDNPKLVKNIVDPGFIMPGKRLIWSNRARASQILFVAWRKLPDELQAVLAVRYVDQLSLGEIANMTGKSREQIRRLEARALRKMRFLTRCHVDELKASICEEIIPDGPADPAWISIRQASELTELTPSHLCYLGRMNRVVSRRHPTRKNLVQLKKGSLHKYVLTPPERNRKRGIWRE